MSEAKKENNPEMTQLTDEEIEGVSGGGTLLITTKCSCCGKTLGEESAYGPVSGSMVEYSICDECAKYSGASGTW